MKLFKMIIGWFLGLNLMILSSSIIFFGKNPLLGFATLATSFICIPQFVRYIEAKYSFRFGFYKRVGLFLLWFVFLAIYLEPIEKEENVQKDESSEIVNEKIEKTNEDNTSKDYEYMYVTVENLNKRTCPSSECGITGQALLNNRLKIFEKQDGFARVTDYYNACDNGVHDFVDQGNSNCTVENGMKDGLFAEWVSLDYLSLEEKTPSNSLDLDYALVAGSDDYSKYKDSFLNASQKLISNGTCTEKEIREDIWWKSTTTYASSPVYFIYCGSSHTSNRIYLNAETGRIFK